jgi:hypothetical protein
MDPIDVALLFASACLALLVRAMMKRLALRKLGRANDALLEIDFWRATSGEALTRGLVFVELLAWLACILLVAMLAGAALGH